VIASLRGFVRERSSFQAFVRENQTARQGGSVQAPGLNLTCNRLSGFRSHRNLSLESYLRAVRNSPIKSRIATVRKLFPYLFGKIERSVPEICEFDLQRFLFSELVQSNSLLESNICTRGPSTLPVGLASEFSRGFDSRPASFPEQDARNSTTSSASSLSKFAVNGRWPQREAAFHKRRSLRRAESRRAPLTKSECAMLLTWEMIRRQLSLR
jgi:hypothetical protein